MRKEQAVEDCRLAEEYIDGAPDERSAKYYPEDPSAPKPPVDRYASDYKQRQHGPQRFLEQDPYIHNGRRAENPHSPRNPREPNNNKKPRPRALSPGNRRSWSPLPNRPDSRPVDERYEYESRRPRYSREEQMRYWERNNEYEMPHAYEEVRHSESRYHRGPEIAIGSLIHSAGRRPVREDLWTRSRTLDKFAHLHDTIDRLNAELIASQEQRYILEKENADLEFDLEEFRLKSLRSFDSLREQDQTVGQMAKEISMLKEKIRRMNKELSEKDKETTRFQLKVKWLRSIGEKCAEFNRQRDEPNDKLKKTTSQLTLLWKEQEKLRLVNDANRDQKHQIQQYQGTEIYQEPQSRCGLQNNSFRARNRPAWEKNINHQLHSAERQQGKIQQDHEVKLKVSDNNIQEEKISSDRYQAQSQRTARHGSFSNYPDSSGRPRVRGQPEERGAMEELTRRGRSPVARNERNNYQNPSVRQRARSQAEPPRWFSQMDRNARDELEQLFASADKDFSGDPDAIKCMLKNRTGLEKKQCGDIYNYFMRSEFVYRAGKYSTFKNRSPATNSSHLNSFLIPNSGPKKYDGPLKGRDNTFWVKFRNPHLKEEIEAAEGPVLTPTQTPDTSPEPEVSLEKKNE